MKLKGTKVVCGAKVPQVRKFHGTKVLGLFAPRERMFHGAKVPRERKFSLWSFHSRERKCRGTKRPVTNVIRCYYLPHGNGGGVLSLLFVYLSVCLSVYSGRISSETAERICLKFCTWTKIGPSRTSRLEFRWR